MATVSLAFLLLALRAGAVFGQTCITFGQTRRGMPTQTADTTMCSDLQLDELPTHISAQTVMLQFARNRLTYLHRDMLLRLPLLEEADFSANEIVHIGYNVTSRSLHNLSLSSNRLRIIPNGTFEHMPNLLHLDLSKNEIWVLFSDSFRRLSRLQVLDLGSNLINSVDPRSFAPLSSLRQLNLATNVLQSLPEQMNGSITSTLRSVKLGNNRWTCDCHTLWLKVLLTEYNVMFDKHDLLCTQAAVPSALGKRWFELRYAEFACPPTLLFPTGAGATKEAEAGSDVILVCRMSQPVAIVWKRYSGSGESGWTELDSNSNKYQASWKTEQSDTLGTLTITRAADSDTSTYSCEAANLAGSATGNWTLWVREADDGPSSWGPAALGPPDADSQALSGNTLSLLAVIGALVGVLVVLIVLAALLVHCVQLMLVRGRSRARRLQTAEKAAHVAPSATTLTLVPHSGRYVSVHCRQAARLQLADYDDSHCSYVTLHSKHAACPVHGLPQLLLCPAASRTSTPELLPLNDLQLAAAAEFSAQRLRCQETDIDADVPQDDRFMDSFVCTPAVDLPSNILNVTPLCSFKTYSTSV